MCVLIRCIGVLWVWCGRATVGESTQVYAVELLCTHAAFLHTQHTHTHTHTHTTTTITPTTPLPSPLPHHKYTSGECPNKFQTPWRHNKSQIPPGVTTAAARPKHDDDSQTNLTPTTRSNELSPYIPSLQISQVVK